MSAGFIGFIGRVGMLDHGLVCDREGGEEELSGQLGGAGDEAHTTHIVYMGLQVRGGLGKARNVATWCENPI